MNQRNDPSLKSFVKWLIIYFAVFFLSGCGSKDSSSNQNTQSTVQGRVFTQMPEAGAFITLKDSAGNVVGSTIADENGYYQITWNVSGTYMVKALTQSGQALYAVGVSDSLNLTSITTQTLQIWFASKASNLESVYESYTSASELPDPYEIEFVQAALMSQSDILSDSAYMSLTEDQIDSKVALFLQQTTVSAVNSTSFVAYMLSGGSITAFPVRSTIGSTGQVEFSGFPMLETCLN